MLSKSECERSPRLGSFCEFECFDLMVDVDQQQITLDICANYTVASKHRAERIVGNCVTRPDLRNDANA
jgi:hypothetical protein